jgi:acid stress chaperone HdeB
MKPVKLRHALIAAAMLIYAAPAHAQVLDLSTLKCGEFLKSGKDAIAYIVIWLDGYHSDQDASAVMDFSKIATKVERFGEYCGKNPGTDMVSAAKEVLGK